MVELIAQGTQRRQRWRRGVPANRWITVGRHQGPWGIAWDKHASRRHVQIHWDGNLLQVSQIPEAVNPVYHRGKAKKEFSVRPGEHFVIGSTRLSLVDRRLQLSIRDKRPHAEHSFAADYLRTIEFRQARQQIDALTRIPELISGTPSDQQLCERLVDLTLEGIPRSTASAVIFVTDPPNSDAVEVLHWDFRGQTQPEFQPSLPLIHTALGRAESVVRTWEQTDENAQSEGQEQHDEGPRWNWALAVPVPGVRCRGWCVYVVGSQLGRSDGLPHEQLQDTLKFMEVLTSTVGNVCDLRHLQQRNAALAQFFSPPIRAALSEQHPEEALAPREASLSVMFCDLHGFSRQSERSSSDLFGLLQRTGHALGIATRAILQFGGVIGDFHGDATMGFWGWPVTPDDQMTQVCLAAMQIRHAFESDEAQTVPSMAGFQVGMGIASGPGVAGKIGTADQVKVTAFGPVVNLAARLEGLTRVLGARILLDETTSDHVRIGLAAHGLSVRRRCLVRPYGMTRAVRLFELLSENDLAELDDQNDQDRYQQILDSFEAGNWKHTGQLLAAASSRDRFLEFLRGYLQTHRSPPNDWQGILSFERKR